MKTLSDRPRNVIRRQMRATPVTYTGPFPTCPNCGSPTYPQTGRYGRFYSCIHYGCYGTHGARPDGTPRKRRPESDALVETRRAIQHLVQFESARVVTNQWCHLHLPDYVYDPSINMATLYLTLEEEARIGGAYIRYKGKRPCNENLGVFWDVVCAKGVWGLALRYRSPAELLALRAAAQRLLHQRRRNAWDHLVLGED